MIGDDDFCTDYRPSIDAVTAAQQQAYERNSKQCTTFALHFNPQIPPPVLGFNPNIIQDNFELDLNLETRVSCHAAH
jgi:hypothetical protein